MCSSCEGRPLADGPRLGSLGAGQLVEIDLTSGLPERGQQTFFGPVPGTSHADLVLALREIDPKGVKGVFVRLGSARFALATASEVGDLLALMRDHEVPVTCHANELNNGSMLLAAKGCSSIWLSPGGSVDTIGLAFQLLFAKSLLEKLEVSVDFLQVGKYKGAQEPYTRDEPSPEARETMESTLKALRSAWASGIALGRKKPELDALLEDAPHPATTAKDLGLIDHVGFLDEAKTAAKELAKADDTEVVFGAKKGQSGGGMSEILRVLAGSDPGADPHVALVRASGAITMGGGGGLLGGGDGITEQALGKTVRKLREDDAVKAVVLRIDSPGGSALASDLLWHELMLLREKKPLVISVGSMAASGGYYLACAGSRIFAEPTSIVGSIGVVAGKLSLQKPLAEIGVNVVTLPAQPGERGARATMMSPLVPWDDATREKVHASMRSIYDLFLERISSGRPEAKSDLEAAAEGRIFGGVRAKELGLIDELGGLDAALRYALTAAELGGEGKVRVRGEAPGLAELLAGDEAAARLSVLYVEKSLDPTSHVRRSLPAEAVDWVDAIGPLAEGERVVASLPFGLMLR